MTLTKGTLSMTERTLTAMYDTRGAAESARDGLVALGIPADAIAIRGTEDDRDTTTVDEDQGFWASLANLFVPDEDRHIYAEGVRRGGYLLTAQVPESTAEQAREVLERSDPVDIDERAASWRQSGWTGYEADKPSYAGASATAAYSEGAGLAETDPAFAPATTPVSTARQERAGVSLAPAAASGGTVSDIGHEDVVQAAEEELRVGKRDVGRGSVRVRSYVTERPVEEQVELRQERVTIERRPVDRAVAARRGGLHGAHDRGRRTRRGGGGLQDRAGDRGDRPAQGRRAGDRDGPRYRAQAGGRGRRRPHGACRARAAGDYRLAQPARPLI